MPTTGGSTSLESYGPESVLLHITGTSGNDNLRVQMENGLVRATVNNVTTYYMDSTVTSIWMEGLAGDDTIDVESNSDNPVNMYGDEGLDTLNLSFINRNLDGITAPVQAFAGADSASCNLYDDALLSHDDTYTVTATTITRPFFAGVTFGQEELYSLRLICQDGNNIINVQSTPSLTETEIRGGPGNDICRLTPTGSNLDALGGTILFVGGVDQDEIYFYDQANTSDDDWEISTGAIRRDGMDDVSYFAESVILFQGTGDNQTDIYGYIQESLHIDSWKGDDTVTVLGLSASSDVNVFGYDGNDTMYIEKSDADSSITFVGEDGADTLELSYYAGKLANIAGEVEFSGGLQSNSLNLNDGSNTANDSYFVASNFVSTSGGFGAVTCSDTNVNLFASTGNNLISVDTTEPNVNTQVHAGDGTDTIRVAYSTGHLGFIAGPAFADGGAGDDVLEAWDDQDNSGANYTFLDGAIIGDEFAAITFVAIEEADLHADDGANYINVRNSSAIKQFVFGGAGEDFIIVADSVAPVRIHGGVGLDHIGIDHEDIGPDASAILLYNDDLSEMVVGASSTLFLSDDITIIGNDEVIGGAVSFGHRSTYIAKVSPLFFPLPVAHAYTQAGYNGGAWNGTDGAFSSAYSAGTPIGDGIGYARATDLAITSYNGFPVGPGDMIFTQTLYGDADLNHTVNFADLLKVAQNYNLPGKFWFHGDFDYDQLVSFPDVLRVAQNYGLSSSTWSARGGMADTILRRDEKNSIVQ